VVLWLDGGFGFDAGVGGEGLEFGFFVEDFVEAGLDPVGVLVFFSFEHR